MGDSVRAPGLEPGLVRGKSPVPYQSGVTRQHVGREGIEPPVSVDGSFTASCAPWRDRPVRCGCQGAGGRAGCPALAGPEGIEPSAVGFGDRGAASARACAYGETLTAHDGVRGFWKRSGKRRRELLGYQRMPGCRPPSANTRHAGPPRNEDDRPGHADAPSTAWALPRFACSVRSLRAIGSRY